MQTSGEREKIYIIDTEDVEPAIYPKELNLFRNRDAFDNMIQEKNTPLVTLVFIAYNNLEKHTKPAIEALLNYTSHIDMELVLVDNGSSDGTWEFFQTVNFPRKRLCRVTKNIGAVMAMVAAKMAVGQRRWGKYLCTLPNDIFVTRNWLDNLLRCMESDERIGIAVPVSNYVSNEQDVDLKITDYEDMQKKAERYNKSDPQKWEERLRVIPTTLLMRNSLYRIYQQDYAFIYYFSDDDLSMQYRRMGYKLMVCRDTFVYHNGSLALKNSEEYHKVLKAGKEIFKRKYLGIDPWEDMTDDNAELIPLLMKHCLKISCGKRAHHILGVDVRCGQPLLSAKNYLRRHNCGSAHLSAYTEDPKYWTDLKLICDGEVTCGIDPKGEAFDEIILGERINQYPSLEKSLGRWIPKLGVMGRIAFRYLNYPLKGCRPINYQEVEAYLHRYSNCKIREINFTLLKEPDDYRKLWDELNLQANQGNQNARERLQREFADSCRFGNYVVGEVLIIVERVQ